MFQLHVEYKNVKQMSEYKKTETDSKYREQASDYQWRDDQGKKQNRAINLNNCFWNFFQRKTNFGILF